MPILWEEPFGIAIAKELARGTLVLGLRRRSVPELVKGGATRLARADIGSLVAAVKDLISLQRHAFRDVNKTGYSDRPLINGCLSLLADVLAGRPASPLP